MLVCAVELGGQVCVLSVLGQCLQSYKLQALQMQWSTTTRSCYAEGMALCSLAAL